MYAGPESAQHRMFADLAWHQPDIKCLLDCICVEMVKCMNKEDIDNDILMMTHLISALPMISHPLLTMRIECILATIFSYVEWNIVSPCNVVDSSRVLFVCDVSYI